MKIGHAGFAKDKYLLLSKLGSEFDLWEKEDTPDLRTKRRMEPTVDYSIGQTRRRICKEKLRQHTVRRIKA